MALTLSYTVTSLKVKDEVNSEGVTLENAVCQTYWTVTGTDSNGNTGEFQGATPFSAANVAQADFTNFADLEEATVVGWITAVVDGDPGYKAHIEEQIQRMIDQDVQTEQALPWATDDATPAGTPEAEEAEPEAE